MSRLSHILQLRTLLLISDAANCPFSLSDYFTTIQDYLTALYVGGGGEGALVIVGVGGSSLSDSDGGIWGCSRVAGLIVE